jgi:hypothetical protein
MNDVLSLSHGVSIGWTSPHDSERGVSLLVATGQATLSQQDTEKLYIWLHEHRISFISFYGKGWKLAQQYWQAEGEPSSYHYRLAVFNAHCHDIGVAPYQNGDTGPSELAVNGFFAALHHMEAEQSDQVQEQEESDQR